MSNQCCMADNPSIQLSQLSKVVLFKPTCESSRCSGDETSVFGGWFSVFFRRLLANNRLCAIQNWLSDVVLMVQFHMSGFFEEGVNYLFRSASCHNNFCWICLSILDSSSVMMLYTWFEAPHSYFLSISFDQSTRAFFWAIVKLCSIQRNSSVSEAQSQLMY